MVVSKDVIWRLKVCTKTWSYSYCHCQISAYRKTFLAYAKDYTLRHLTPSNLFFSFFGKSFIFIQFFYGDINTFI